MLALSEVADDLVHILTTPDDTLAAKVIVAESQVTEDKVTIVDLTQPDADYHSLQPDRPSSRRSSKRPRQTPASVLPKPQPRCCRDHSTLGNVDSDQLADSSPHDAGERGRPMPNYSSLRFWIASVGFGWMMIWSWRQVFGNVFTSATPAKAFSLMNSKSRHTTRSRPIERGKKEFTPPFTKGNTRATNRGVRQRFISREAVSCFQASFEICVNRPVGRASCLSNVLMLGPGRDTYPAPCRRIGRTRPPWGTIKTVGQSLDAVGRDVQVCRSFTQLRERWKAMT